ncbi:MAG: hypothetical protein CXZ00_03220 [Acidobacteria bacterium]|nr:MAG: hypothetical protein CXZ00_03220 [Acidobacteriota bacterium]
MSENEKVLELFTKRYNCAQAVFATCGPCEGFTEEMCLAVAGPFGGGMGCMGETCGAVTGAFMALGVRCGQGMVTNPIEAAGPIYKRVNELAEAFKARHGSLLCRELTGCDMRTPEGKKQFKDRGLHDTLCPKFLLTAVELLKEQR